MSIDTLPANFQQIEDIENIGKTKNETAQVSRSRGEKNAIEKGPDGKDYITIEGLKFVCSPEKKIKETPLSEIESKTGIFVQRK